MTTAAGPRTKRRLEQPGDPSSRSVLRRIRKEAQAGRNICPPGLNSNVVWSTPPQSRSLTATPLSRSASAREGARQYRTRFAQNLARVPAQDDTRTKDEPRGHCEFEIGDKLDDRYVMLDWLGEGTFSRVIECFDIVEQKKVAIKVLRKLDKYRIAGENEFDLLMTLARTPNTRGTAIVQAHRLFEHQGHMCVVLERLGKSVHQALRLQSYMPFGMEAAKHIVRQVLQCIKALHDVGIIHTDVKSDNILFVEDGKKARENEFEEVKIVDFGSALHEAYIHPLIVSTRQYRAPEIVLQLDWSKPCDIWSVGCIAFEVCCGRTPFPIRNDHDHVRLVEIMLENFPKWMGEGAAEHLRDALSDGLNDSYRKPRTRSDAAIENVGLQMQTILHRFDETTSDFLRSLLTIDPNKRPSAEEALRHPWLQ